MVAIIVAIITIITIAVVLIARKANTASSSTSTQGTTGTTNPTTGTTNPTTGDTGYGSTNGTIPTTALQSGSYTPPTVPSGLQYTVITTGTSSTPIVITPVQDTSTRGGQTVNGFTQSKVFLVKAADRMAANCLNYDNTQWGPLATSAGMWVDQGAPAISWWTVNLRLADLLVNMPAMSANPVKPHTHKTLTQTKK